MADKLLSTVISIRDSPSTPPTPREMVQGLAGMKMTPEGIAHAERVLEDPRVYRACRTDQELNRAVGQVNDDLRNQWMAEQAKLSEDVTVFLIHGGKTRISQKQYLEWVRAGFFG